MRTTIILLLTLFAASTSLAGLEGTSIDVVEPEMPILPGETYVFIFDVTREAGSGEHLTQIEIVFPYGLIPMTYTLGFDEIEAGRPEFSSWPYLQTARWWEENPDTGGIHAGEVTRIWVTVSTWDGLPDGAVGSIPWKVRGNSGSELEGECGVSTPAEDGTWGAIKALFR